ncbi:homocysteine S-methyltransferase YbgG-like [Leptopilina heterotoma]|uniref:homocysteine S-methyltransferase YbgG-like n=1 Tax=Leptopilina heterotoma TaxID=63436 RepID=UPI001CA87C98|nr:homocysteine S-methyltransferase YbgG-like [Leptopilina heterotoma]
MSSVKLLDGGFSTQLSKHVGEKIDGDPLWTAKFLVTDPMSVLSTHLDFLRAGSDIIQTNTYQATITGFVKYLNISRNESLKLIHDAVDLAKRAVSIFNEENEYHQTNRKPLIAGSCGPYGAALHDASEYTGAYAKTVTLDKLINWHRPRIETLINAGVDMLALETIPCATEADALIELLRDYPETKAWLAFSCRDDGKSLADGSNFKETAIRCYKKALPGQILAIGVNCIAPKVVTPLLRGINSDTDSNSFIPLIVYPNSGEKYSVPEGWRFECNTLPPENFVHEWLDLGVRYLGGCCRTNVTTIKKIKTEIDTYVKS